MVRCVWLEPLPLVCRFCVNQAEEMHMDQQTVHKTYKEKLRPTPAQERALEHVLWRCRALHNTALEQRITGLPTPPRFHLTLRAGSCTEGHPR